MGKKIYRVTGGIVPPAILRSPKDDRLYIVPWWVPIPEGTTMDQIVWERPEVRQTRQAPPVSVSKKFVVGSSGEKYVVTTLSDGTRTCTCKGFQFRRFCKHTGAK